MRGKEVSRIEGFSDAVFGFALTLLVVSLEVPQDFAALRRTLVGFPAFAVTFAVVSWIWYEQMATDARSWRPHDEDILGFGHTR